MKLGAILQVGKEQVTQRQRRLGHDNRINNEEMKDYRTLHGRKDTSSSGIVVD